MQKNKIIISTARNKESFVTVKGKNNKTLAVTETYKRQQGAQNAAEALKKVLKNAVVINKTKKK